MATKRHYVNNKDFYQAICDYRELLKDKPEARVPEYVGVCIMKICERLSTKHNFVAYPFRDEMVSDGIEACMRAVPSFNPEKTSNPFAYFTRCAWNAFIHRISHEKRELYVKHKNMQHMMLVGDMQPGSSQNWDSTGINQIKNNEPSNDIITSFESKLLKQKKQSKIAGVEKFLEQT